MNKKQIKPVIRMNNLLLNLKKSICKSPITAMGLFCLLIPFLYRTNHTQSVEGPFGFTMLFWVVLAVGFVVSLVVLGRKSIRKVIVAISFWLLVAFGALWMDCQNLSFLNGFSQPNPELVLLAVGTVCLVLCGFSLWTSGKLNFRTASVLLIGFGILIRLCYVLYTPVYMRQHDVFTFSNGDFMAFTYQRHAEYIEYIATYLKLPQVDPTQVGLSQLYHPPFHHILAGLWLRLNLTLGETYAAACENIQFLTLFYSSACMIITYRLLRLLGCKGWSLLLPLGIVCCHPTLILMAGSVNNDLLSITLAFYAVYAAIRWFKQPTVYHIVTVALGVGLSMMTKLSGGLVAVGIGFLFLAKWLQAIAAKQGKPVFWQLALFGVICVPLALWWQVKNAVLYQIPLTYVPSLTQYSGQYLGGYSTLQRLVGFEPGWYEDLFMAWRDQGQFTSYNEYNLVVALVKTSVFGEFTLFTQETMGQYYSAAMAAGYGLICTNLVLIGLSLYAGVRCMLRYWRNPITWCLVLVWGAILFSYVQFCFAYPQTCTQNFRYAVPTLLCGLCALGIHAKTASKGFRVLLGVSVLGFLLAAVATYGMLLLG